MFFVRGLMQLFLFRMAWFVHGVPSDLKKTVVFAAVFLFRKTKVLFVVKNAVGFGTKLMVTTNETV